MIRDVFHTLYVLENIGIPLLIATLRSATPKAEEVTKVREMLDRTVQLTREIEKRVNADKKDPMFPQIKLKLASIASTVIASKFETEGQLLSEHEIPGLLEDIDFLLTHLENFNIQEQLQASFREQTAGDPSNNSPEASQSLKYINAFIPILHAIEEFPYGQSEKKLIQAVSDELSSRSKIMKNKLIGEGKGDIQRNGTDLTFLCILAALYAETHRAETKKIMHMSEKTRTENGSQLTIEIVWRAFDRKCAMLETLIEGLIPAQKQQEADGDEHPSLEILLPPTQAQTSNPLSFYKKPHKS